MSSTNRTLLKAAGFLMAAQMASRLLGFLRETLIAGFFGQSRVTDAYNTAFILPDLLYWLLVGGVLSAAFIPVFSEYIAQGNEDEGWRVVSSVVNIIFLALGLFVLFGLFFTPEFLKLMVPGFQAKDIALTTHLTRILLMQPLFMAFSGLTMGVLNSYKIFWPSALGTVLYNASVIFFGTILANPGKPESISGFAVGVVVGALVNFAIQIPALRKVGIRYHPIIDWRHPGVRRISALAVPIILSYSLNQIQIAVNNNFGSTLFPGSISAIWYSSRLFQMPVGIFALAIAVASFPTMTEQAALKQWDSLRETISRTIRMVVFITLPVSVGMIVLRFPLIRALFQHGHFTAEDTARTTVPLLYFCLGISAQSVIQILPRAFYALQDTWTPVVLGLISMAIDILCMFLLVHPLAAGGLALADTVSAVVNMFLLFYVLRKKLGKMDGRNMLGTGLKTLLSSLLMAAVIWVWNQWATRFLGVKTISSLIVLISGTVLGALVFAVAAKLLKMEEFDQTIGLLQRRFRRAS
ncbi:integral membrane protein MviN [Desulfosporosinus acidiphilus SJ4]|uniref:Probable lipid II flippase MurJ n=1 Tax=Desulfosporosinus acidiphilus (strain DSM 22704 / JCM 16185 / SJ4) TaxID=646529 RepID=I4DAT1_DESAJ|nr:murein biosynthesis integral membrane protein MurJ [Desulfosporosinus acidiphilus]AFM42905.1 integral membrane protein MviN [Desulfosporosinus acidiphilus SJ4]